MNAKFALLLLLTGCRQLFGLDDPAPMQMDPDAPASPADAAADAVWQCPSTYVSSSVGGTGHYRFVEQRARWLDAVTLCTNDQPSGPPYTHLVVIGSDEERQSLLPLRALTNDAYWIGLTDLRVTGTWQPVTDEVITYPPPWSPDPPMQGADCVVIVGPMYGVGTNGMYAADFCKPPASVSLPFICECDGYPDDPTNH